MSVMSHDIKRSPAALPSEEVEQVAAIWILLSLFQKLSLPSHALWAPPTGRHLITIVLT